MSWAAIKWAMTEVELKSDGSASADGQHHVLCALAYYANAEGEAWPSVETLTLVTHRSESAIRRSLRALERAGLIVGPSDDRRRKGGRNLSTRYRLNVGNPVSMTPFKESKTRSVEAVNPVSKGPKPGHADPREVRTSEAGASSLAPSGAAPSADRFAIQAEIVALTKDIELSRTDRYFVNTINQWSDGDLASFLEHIKIDRSVSPTL